MPKTREEHVLYTSRELNTYPYYIKVIEELVAAKISSYFDIGANVGEFCKVLFEKIPTLKTAYLAEPEIENFVFMTNHVRSLNAKCYNVAIGYGFSSGNIVCHKSGNIGGFSVVPLACGQNLIQVKTIEEILPCKVDFIKIDIEGGEFNLIENSPTLQITKFVEIEFHLSEAESANGKNGKYIKNSFPNHEILISDHSEKPFERCLLRLRQ